MLKRCRYLLAGASIIVGWLCCVAAEAGSPTGRLIGPGHARAGVKSAFSLIGLGVQNPNAIHCRSMALIIPLLCLVNRWCWVIAKPANHSGTWRTGC